MTDRAAVHDTAAAAAEACIRRFTEAMVAEDTPTLMALAEMAVLMGLRGLNLAAHGRVTSFEIGNHRAEGDRHAYDVTMHADETYRLRLAAVESAGTWRIAAALPLGEDGQPREPERTLPRPSLAWMNAPTEWGVRAEPGPPDEGLTLRRINIGSYGYVPDVWPDSTMRPRGAARLPGVESMGYSIYSKAEVWADSCADLYEQGIQKRWAASTNINWDAIERHPGDLERAMVQLCTELAERAYWKSVIIGRWLREISYGFIEVKAFLSADIFDEARHTEAFRKRAVLFGAGLGVQPQTDLYRAMWDAQSWSELSLLAHVLGDSLVGTIYRWGAQRIARTDAERRLFELSQQDKERALTYGRDHLRYLVAAQPDRREELHNYLRKAENAFAHDLRSSPLLGALAVLLGGGANRIREGLREVDRLRADHLRRYLATCQAAGLDRSERVHAELAKYA